jgi:hypothetical protein
MRPISEILTESVQIYRLRTAELIGYSGWLLLPTAALLLASYIPNEMTKFVLFFAIFVFQIVLWLRICIILCLLSQDAFTDKTTDAAVIQQLARSRSLPLILVSLLVAAVVLGGTILFIIPGLMFAIWFGYAQFLAIFEGKQGLPALAESRNLVQGRFWTAVRYQLFGPITVVFIYSIILALVLTVLGFITQTPLETIFADIPPLWVSAVSAIGDAFMIPLVLLVSVGSYLEFRKGE